SPGIARHSTAFAPSVASVARNNPRECAPWQNIHELGEQRLADIHERLLGKTPNSARSSSNRHHSFAPASYCQINPFQNALAVNRTAVVSKVSSRPYLELRRRPYDAGDGRSRLSGQSRQSRPGGVVC